MRIRKFIAMAVTALAAGAAIAAPPHPSTFSIVAADPEAGEVGVCVASRFFAVGTVVPFAKAGVGAVATQSFANTSYGPRGLELMERGVSAEEVVKVLTRADDGREQRQLGVESKAYVPGPYSKRESLSVQFDREVLRSLGR